MDGNIKAKNPTRPDARLETAVGFVRDGSFIADVGTDHAILPIWLCHIGKIRGAVASDINEGPIRRAEENIRACGYENMIKTQLTDGLDGISGYSPDDIIIFGMGGELIARILSDAEFIKRPGVRLILQPMTHAQNVREFLSENGFGIVGQVLSRDDGRIYQTICAEYDGRAYKLDLPELYFGNMREDKLWDEFMQNNLSVWTKRRDGKAVSNIDVSEENQIISYIYDQINRK